PSPLHFPPQAPTPLATPPMRTLPADPAEIEEPLLIDMGHHQADLIDMAREHDPRLTTRADGGEGVAAHIRRDLIGETLGLGPPDPRRRCLEPARRRCVQQLLQKVDRLQLLPPSTLSRGRRPAPPLHARVSRYKIRTDPPRATGGSSRP